MRIAQSILNGSLCAREKERERRRCDGTVVSYANTSRKRNVFGNSMLIYATRSFHHNSLFFRSNGRAFHNRFYTHSVAYSILIFGINFHHFLLSNSMNSGRQQKHQKSQKLFVVVWIGWVELIVESSQPMGKMTHFPLRIFHF